MVTGARRVHKMTGLVAAVLLSSASVVRSQNFACTVHQLTHTSGVQIFAAQPSISADGSRIGFRSTADLVPSGNLDSNAEIFLFDVATSSFEQVTSSTTSFTSVSPSLNVDGSLVAFSSDADLVPPGNPSGLPQIFLFDAATSTLAQITTTVASPSLEPSLSANGSRIAFRSVADLVPPDNMDGNQEIFLANVGAPGFVQVTKTASPVMNREPSISDDGTRIAFRSGTSLGTSEIFLFDSSVPSLTQVTSTSLGQSHLPAISGDGTRIAFRSSGDLLPPGNSDNTAEIFLFDVASSNLFQITETTLDSHFPSLNGDGNLVAFVSMAEFLVGGNPEGNFELFLFDRVTGNFTQVTAATAGDSTDPSISANGSRIAFISSADLVPMGNPDANDELFLADCLSDTDGDGLPDSIDPDIVGDAVADLSDTSFRNSGAESAILDRLADIELNIVDGRIADAIRAAENLRRRLDGCEDGPPADKNDWIVDCASQDSIRALLDALISNLMDL
jgi:Tol biopolymer transport system component